MASILRKVRGLEEKILATIGKYNMLEMDDKVLVAVSGGPDSIALLILLCSIRTTFNLEFHVFHLNHLIRGESSSEEAAFVQRIAAAMGLPISNLSYDVLGYVHSKNLSLQEGAREIRYQLLDEVCNQIGADKIALGHTADDQVETFLMRIIRGTGLSGLRGIPPVRGRIIRPLIELSRREIETYLSENGIEYRLDESNLKMDYLRNRLRHKLIPLLREQNERFQENVLNTIALVSDDEHFLDQVTGETFKNIAYYEDDGILYIRYSRLRELSLALQRRVIRRALESVKGNLREIEYKHVELIISKMKQGENLEIDLPGGIAVANEYGNIAFALSDELQKRMLSDASKVELKIPGVTNIPSLGIDINARLEDSAKVDASSNRDRHKGYMDFQKLELPLWVRARLPGDRFIPLGMSNEKKLQDYFVDKKIPRRKRDNIPIVECQGHIVWIGGMIIDDRVKVTYDTDKILVLEIK